MGKSSVDFEVQGSLTVDEVTDLDTGYNHNVMPVVLLALVRWFGQPEEGKDEHNEAISHIVALLNHAVNELLNDEDQNHKERKAQVEHLLRLEVFTLSYISEPSSGLRLPFQGLQESDNECCYCCNFHWNELHNGCCVNSNSHADPDDHRKVSLNDVLLIMVESTDAVEQDQPYVEGDSDEE